MTKTYKKYNDVDLVIMGLKSFLQEDEQHRIHVLSYDSDGNLISMGSIDKSMLYEKNSMALKVINKIRFARRD